MVSIGPLTVLDENPGRDALLEAETSRLGKIIGEAGYKAHAYVLETNDAGNVTAARTI